MILFWLICAALIAIALAFILPPLLQRASTAPENSDKDANVAVYRDQVLELEADLQNGNINDEQYAIEREEIERRLLEDVSTATNNSDNKRVLAAGGRGLVYAIALTIPLLAIGLYFRIGSPQAISASTSAPAQTAAPVPGQGMSQQAIEANVATLARRLEQNPNDANGWRMLGRSYLTMEKYKDATVAFARASALTPEDADLLADYAFSLGMANGQRLRGQPQELINKALKLDPENPKALELAGTAAFEAKNYKDAIAFWERLLKKSPGDTELTTVLTERINRARSLDSVEVK
jgi:cytochrome c-type biogenesis protein CcmH